MGFPLGLNKAEQKRLQQLVSAITRYGGEALLVQWGLSFLLPEYKAA